MPSDIRYEVVIAISRLVLRACGCPETATALRDRVAFLILEAAYEIERRLADEPSLHVLCPWCLRSLRRRPDVEGNRECCPRCGGRMQRPELANCN